MFDRLAEPPNIRGGGNEVYEVTLLADRCDEAFAAEVRRAVGMIAFGLNRSVQYPLGWQDLMNATDGVGNADFISRNKAQNGVLRVALPAGWRTSKGRKRIFLRHGLMRLCYLLGIAAVDDAVRLCSEGVGNTGHPFPAYRVVGHLRVLEGGRNV